MKKIYLIYDGTEVTDIENSTVLAAENTPEEALKIAAEFGGKIITYDIDEDDMLRNGRPLFKTLKPENAIPRCGY